MNRKQKIIVSITGITLVLLILVGLTYAYFLTRIQGNTNNKSIEVTTKDLALVYRDGTPEILFAEKIIPDNEHPIGTKEFNVTNTGNAATDYMVVIDDIVIKTLSTNPASDSSFESFDFTYTLTCTQYDVSTDLVSGTCVSQTVETKLPRLDDSVLITNNINEGMRQEYVLTVYYKDTGINQSDDMNKSLEAIVDIRDVRRNNPYSSNTNSLAYNIINNALLKKNGTELRNAPLTRVASELSGENEKVLAVAPDDYGNSYYFRGSVTDNYVNFAGMCWRIVRIEGDGSTKIILEDKDTLCQNIDYDNGDGNWNIPTETGGDYYYGVYGYTQFNSRQLTTSDGSTINVYQRNILNYLSGETLAEKSLAHAFLDFQSTTVDNNKSLEDLIKDYYNDSTLSLSSYLKVDDWCIDDTAYSREENGNKYNFIKLSAVEALDKKIINNFVYYDSYRRLSGDDINGFNPIFKCSVSPTTSFSDSTPMYVATITADELVFSGSSYAMNNSTDYLLNKYQVDNVYSFKTITPWYFQGNESVGTSGYDHIAAKYSVRSFGYMAVSTGNMIRPSIVLRTGTTISSGDGTIENPYIIS